MRRLLLLRHAKAAPAIGRDDYARALTDRGREDAAKVGSLIAERGLVPDLVVYSSAERTRETADIVAQGWPAPVKRIAENALYEASRPLIMALVQRLPQQAGSALIVGHNPGMADVANQLTGEGPEHDLRRMASRFPTSGLAIIEFPSDAWTEARARQGRLVAFVAAGDALA